MQQQHRQPRPLRRPGERVAVAPRLWVLGRRDAEQGDGHVGEQRHVVGPGQPDERVDRPSRPGQPAWYRSPTSAASAASWAPAECPTTTTGPTVTPAATTVATASSMAHTTSRTGSGKKASLRRRPVGRGDHRQAGRGECLGERPQPGAVRRRPPAARHQHDDRYRPGTGCRQEQVGGHHRLAARSGRRGRRATGAGGEQDDRTGASPRRNRTSPECAAAGPRPWARRPLTAPATGRRPPPWRCPAGR